LAALLIIVQWRESPALAVAEAVLVEGVLVVFHGLAWGREGELRMRYMRRYGAPTDTPEHRWLPEKSSWPF
jgi:hypothetical protein